MNLATMGQNAAAGQGTATMQAGGTISDLLTQQGNALAAGQVGAANANTQGINNLLNLGTTVGVGLATGGLGLSDVRLKEDIERIGTTDSGLGVYKYRFKGRPEFHVGVIAQEVEKVYPDAVTEIDGIKYVRMERLH